jgi:hypothetical protein
MCVMILSAVMLCWVPSCIGGGGLVRLLHAFLDLRSLEILKSVKFNM